MTPKQLLALWDECNRHYHNRHWGAYVDAWRRLMIYGGWTLESPDSTAYGS